MPSFHEILHWFIEHATWDALVSLIEAYWKEEIGTVVVVVIGALGLTRAKKQKNEIRFDYLPASPLDNGWRVASGAPGPTAKWLSSTDSPVRGSISIEMDPDCAIEKILEPNLTLSDRVVYSAKYSGTTMLFMRVGLATVDGSRTTNKWIKFDVGQGLPYRKSPGYENEWTLPVNGPLQPNGWMRFDIALRDAVGKTWGTLGWTFTSLQIIRLRGNLAITPLQLSQSRRQRD
jgi:hypothetical protein